jgi:F-type H+-transporting ATPase subunit b
MLTAFVPSARTADTHSLLIPEIPDLVWGSLAFIIILVIVVRVFVPRMTAMFDARADAIEGGLKRAEEAQAGAQQALENYNAQLAEARAEAGTIREQARQDGVKILNEFKEHATAEAARITASASTHIEAERQAALVSLRAEVGSLAIDLASGVIGQSLADDTRAASLVDQFLAELESSENTNASEKSSK